MNMSCKTCRWKDRNDGYCEDKCLGFDRYEPAEVKKELNQNNCITCKNRNMLMDDGISVCHSCIDNSNYEFQGFMPHKSINKERERQYLMAAMKITKNHSINLNKVSDYLRHAFPEKIFIGRISNKFNTLYFKKDYSNFAYEYLLWIAKYFPEKYNLIFGGE